MPSKNVFSVQHPINRCDLFNYAFNASSWRLISFSERTLGRCWFSYCSFQNKALRTMVNAPWYVPNKLLHTDLQMPTIREEITKCSTNHRAKLLTLPNTLTSNLLTEQGPGRLKRYKPFDLSTRFSWLACKIYFVQYSLEYYSLGHVLCYHLLLFTYMYL
jgi:hypothetical protein